MERDPDLEMVVPVGSDTDPNSSITSAHVLAPLFQKASLNEEATLVSIKLKYAAYDMKNNNLLQFTDEENPTGKAWTSVLETEDAKVGVDLEQPHVMSLRLDKMGAISPLAVVCIKYIQAII